LETSPNLDFPNAIALLPALGIWRLRVPPGQERAILAQLQADPAVTYADFNYLVFAQ